MGDVLERVQRLVVRFRTVGFPSLTDSSSYGRAARRQTEQLGAPLRTEGPSHQDDDPL